MSISEKILGITYFKFRVSDSVGVDRRVALRRGRPFV